VALGGVDGFGVGGVIGESALLYEADTAPPPPRVLQSGAATVGTNSASAPSSPLLLPMMALAVLGLVVFAKDWAQKRRAVDVDDDSDDEGTVILRDEAKGSRAAKAKNGGSKTSGKAAKGGPVKGVAKESDRDDEEVDDALELGERRGEKKNKATRTERSSKSTEGKATRAPSKADARGAPSAGRYERRPRKK